MSMYTKEFRAGFKRSFVVAAALLSAIVSIFSLYAHPGAKTPPGHTVGGGD